MAMKLTLGKDGLTIEGWLDEQDLSPLQTDMAKAAEKGNANKKGNTVNEKPQPKEQKLTKNMKDSVPESRMSKDTSKPTKSSEERLAQFRKGGSK